MYGNVNTKLTINQVGEVETKVYENGKTLFLDGHFGSVTLHEQCCSSVGKRFQASQIWVHSPAEHKVNGEGADLEIQIVHQLDFRQSGEYPYLITSYLFKGAEDGVAVDMIDQILKTSGRFAELDLTSSFPQNSKFNGYQYNGSTTMPPCAERVKWFVSDVINVPAGQIEGMNKKLLSQKLEKPSAREVQPLNGRTVQRCGRDHILYDLEPKTMAKEVKMEEGK